LGDVNSAYWRSRDGAYYLGQQQQRAAAGNAMYAQQERWLEDFLSNRSAELGRPLRVLDFGCGFGRLAQRLSGNPAVIYHGYDFSKPMVAPLFETPPEGLDLTRVRVADSLSEAFPSETFDVIFTVAVLIHNTPENAIALVSQMMRKLTQGGRLCLIENTLASFSMRENNWHGGCWVHDFITPFEADWSVDVYRESVDYQDIYVFAYAGQGRARVRIVVGDGLAREVDAAERRLLGLARIEASVRGLEGELEGGAERDAKVHDAVEDVRRMKDELVYLQKRLQLSEAARASLVSIQNLRKRVELAMLGQDTDAMSGTRAECEMHDDAHLFAPVANAAPATYLWNAARDTELAHRDSRFGRVCHVFHQEWFGIRAAAGALPGNKLAITADRVLSVGDITAISRLLRDAGVDRLVMHGFSVAMEAFIRAIREVGFSHLYLVWHGAAAMWVFDGERQLAQAALRLVRKGIIRRMQCMRRGLDQIIGPRAFSPLLLNVAPNLPPSHLPPGKTKKKMTVFSPSWNLLHKNLVTGLLAAQANDRVGEFWTMARDLVLDAQLSSKLRVLSPRSGLAMLETMRSADLLSNVSIVDCHPMVDQEALAVGVPCLRGPLFLDALEDHPYVRATQIANPLSVADVSTGMSRVFDIPRDEMKGMIEDYAHKIRAVSFERYVEFLELN
jgi:SAM-dependent methyltransferase